MAHRQFVLCLLLSLLLIGCQPEERDPDLNPVDAQINQVILTARSDLAPTPTFTPQPTLTPSPSPTPQVDLVILAGELEAYAAPIRSYGVKFTLSPQDPIRVIGRNAECTWLQVLKNETDAGWIRNRDANVDLRVRCDDLPLGTFRPKTGYVVLDNRPQQDWTALKVENGLLTDGVIVLADQTKNPIFAFYVRANDTHTVEGLPTGAFLMYFSTGERWLASANQFSRNSQFQLFEEPFEFLDGTEWNISLHPVIGGTGKTDLLDQEQFPSLSEEEP